jgi:NAD(P)-dependent dehydrogenase (short-subunit alcohol dehydrogenase family)
MANRLEGKTVIVTGGARGQGAMHGRVLAGEGANIVLADMLDDAGEATAQELRNLGLEVEYRHLDVTDEDAWRAVVAAAETRFGRIDGLVNNAGIFQWELLESETMEGLLRMFAVNSGGVFLGMKTAAEAIRRHGDGGSIVNVASMNAHRPAAASFSYNASKAAVLNMTQAAAVTYADDGIRVNSISPGALKAGMLNEPHDPRAETDWRFRGRLGKLALVKQNGEPRRADPEEMSAAILFLLSDEASFVNGTDILVDGGSLAW